MAEFYTMTLRELNYAGDAFEVRTWIATREVIATIAASVGGKKRSEQILPLWIDEMRTQKRMAELDELSTKADVLKRYFRNGTG